MSISKNCSRKQNLIFLFKKEKKEKENKNSSWRKNIDEKVSMYHRDKVSRNIVYKLYMCAHRSDLNDLQPRHDELLIHRCCRSAKRLEQKCYIETLFHVVHPARRKNAFSVCEPRIAITAKRSPINFSNLRQGMRKGVQSHQLYVIISSKRLAENY